MSKFPYHLTGNTLTAYVGGMPYQTDRSNPNWEQIKQLLTDPETTDDQLVNAIKPIGIAAAALTGVANVEILGSQIFVDGEEIHGHLADRLLDIADEGLDVEPWVQFIQNIWANPFTEARDELYSWLERGQMPITPDGCFLAFKVVRSDFLDRHSRTIRYAVGDTPSMPREDCDNDSRALCSNGLHFCSASYLPSFGVNRGDHVMMVKINPADVVAIPRSETNKGRAWRMEVVGEIKPELAGIVSWKPIDDTWDVPDAEVKAPGYVEDPNAEPFVETAALGTVTPSFLEDVKATVGGTWADVARHFNVPSGTLSGWLKTLRKKGAQL